MFRTIPKPTHGSDEWLRVRWQDEEGKARISASNASCVHNENPYKTKAAFAVELMTPPSAAETTPDMERGNRLEPVLINWYNDMTNSEVVTPDVMYVVGRLIATLDGVDKDGIPVEVKTTRKKWTGQLPRHWYWQGVQQAICKDTNKVIWVVFDSDLNMHFHEQIVTSDEKAIHINACDEFLGHIDDGTIPPDAPVDYETAATLYPTAIYPVVELPLEAQPIIDDLARTRRLMSELEANEKKLKGELGMLLGDCEAGTLNGNVVVEWKDVSRTTFDNKGFKEAHPALASKFMKTQTYRMMKFPK